MSGKPYLQKNSEYIGLNQKTAFGIGIGPQEVHQPENPGKCGFSSLGTFQGLLLIPKAVFW